jgi:hypothetical protein
VVAIVDSTGRSQSWGIIATSMAQAISKAQTEAGVTTDPLSVQQLHTIDYDATAAALTTASTGTTPATATTIPTAAPATTTTVAKA